MEKLKLNKLNCLNECVYIISIFSRMDFSFTQIFVRLYHMVAIGYF